MLIDTLAATLLGNLLAGKGAWEQVKEQLDLEKEKLEKTKVHNTVSSFD